VDLLKDLISANAPVGQQDPVGNFITGGNAAQAQTKANIENVNARYQQELAFRLHKAIQESIGKNGWPDPVKLKWAGQKYNIAGSTLSYAVDMLPKVWKSAADIAQSRALIQSYSEEGESDLSKGWATRQDSQTTESPDDKDSQTTLPPDDKTTETTQSSTTAAATPGSAAQSDPLDANTTAFGQRATAWGKGSPLLRSIQKEIGLNGKDADGTWGPTTQKAYRAYLTAHPKAGVVPGLLSGQMQFEDDTTAWASQPAGGVQKSPDGTAPATGTPAPQVTGSAIPSGVARVDAPDPTSLEEPSTSEQRASDAQAQIKGTEQDKEYDDEKSKNAWAIVGNMPLDNVAKGLPDPGANPLQVSKMSTATKLAMKTQLARAGRFGPKASDADLQGALDNDWKNINGKVGNVPIPAMYQDKDGKLDRGAYLLALSEYNAKISGAADDYYGKEGALFGDNLKQSITIQANSRANQQNARDQGNYARSVRDWKLQNASMEDLRSMGYKGIDKTNMEEARSVEGARDNILGIENQLGHLKINSHKMSDGEFNGNVVSVFNKIAELDAAKTEGDRGNIENILLQHKDFRSILSRHGTDWKGAALEFFTRQSKRGTMAIMDEMVNNAKRYGQVNGAARKFGNKNVWAKHIGDKHVLPSGKEAVWNGSSWGVE